MRPPPSSLLAIVPSFRQSKESSRPASINFKTLKHGSTPYGNFPEFPAGLPADSHEDMSKNWKYTTSRELGDTLSVTAFLTRQ
jgi:hypothetical protein